MKRKPENRAKPYTYLLRLPISLYERLKEEAAKDGVPFNQYCIYLLTKGSKEKEQ